SWYDGAARCRAADRNKNTPGYRSFNVGCRLVLCVDQGPPVAEGVAGHAPDVQSVPQSPPAPAVLPVRRERPPGAIEDIRLRNNITMRFAWCPSGTFLMGSPDNEPHRSDDETLHRVTLTEGFWLSVYPVTQAQWQAIMFNNPSKWKGADLP